MSLLKKKLSNKLKEIKKSKVEEELPKNNIKKLSKIEINKKNIQIFLDEKNLPLLKLKEISFSIFDEETFSKKSVCDIENHNRNLDLYYSLEDPRLGTINDLQLCGTCEKTTEDCTGHFSKINLGFNFIHPLYRSEVISILQCICHSCNKLLIKEPTIIEKGLLRMRGVNRLKEFAKLSNSKQSCSNPNCNLDIRFKTRLASDKYNRRNVPYYIKKGKEISEDKYMSVDTVLTRLKAISDKDLETIGFIINPVTGKLLVDPKNFIMNYIPIIPLTDRPPYVTETEKKDHSITYAYNDILTKHLETKYHLLEEETDEEKIYESIINIYSSIIDNKKNDENTYTRNKQEAVESIKDMINCKDGIIRNHLLGKRCDYTGRSVLGPNDMLNFGYIAIPEEMENITIPEIITYYNFDRIKELAKQGKIQYICPKKGNLSGSKLKFDYLKHFDKLSIEDRIERNTEEGDTLTFNRAPTLQPQSMLGYKIVIQDKKTIGVHLSSTKGLNADFDGDEGNTHQIQTPEAQVEARIIMNVENNIMSYSNSTPESALVYNSIISAYLLTADDIILTREEFNNGLDYINLRMKNNYIKNNYSSFKKRIGNSNPLAGKSLFSIILPEDFWYKKIDSKQTLFITDGILRKGRIDGDHIGSTNYSIISFIYKDYGKEIASYFISAANFLLNWYILRIGFTLSFKDVTLREHSESFKITRKQFIDSSNQKLKEINIKRAYTLTEIEEKNKKISIIFENCKKDIEVEVDKLLDLNNSIFLMVDSKAKGSKSKVIEIVGSKSVISVNQQLPEKNMTNNGRWLTTFTTTDYRLQSRGFAVNSYYEGLDVDSYFAECQSGRTGLIDTAVKTASIGYMQRRMVKAQEDLIIYYDGSIRNQQDVIFQYSYGSNFKTNEMIVDNSNGTNVFSFINIKHTIGKINYEKGFSYSIDEEIKNLANVINRKYNFKSENYDDQNEEEEDEKIYIDDDFDDDDE